MIIPARDFVICKFVCTLKGVCKKKKRKKKKRVGIVNIKELVVVTAFSL